jgi:hypothetical protein
MIYRGSGFLAVRWFGSFPPPRPSPLSRQQFISFSQSSYELTVELSAGTDDTPIAATVALKTGGVSQRPFTARRQKELTDGTDDTPIVPLSPP